MMISYQELVRTFHSGIIFALLWAATGIGIAKYEPNEATEHMVEQKS
ncbi:hypothetical protein ACTNF7_005000 [Citrobacter braakii]